MSKLLWTLSYLDSETRLECRGGNSGHKSQVLRLGQSVWLCMCWCRFEQREIRSDQCVSGALSWECEVSRANPASFVLAAGSWDAGTGCTFPVLLPLCFSHSFSWLGTSLHKFRIQENTAWWGNLLWVCRLLFKYQELFVRQHRCLMPLQ